MSFILRSTRFSVNELEEIDYQKAVAHDKLYHNARLFVSTFIQLCLTYLRNSIVVAMASCTFSVKALHSNLYDARHACKQHVDASSVG